MKTLVKKVLVATFWLSEACKSRGKIRSGQNDGLRRRTKTKREKVVDKEMNSKVGLMERERSSRSGVIRGEEGTVAVRGVSGQL